MKIFKPSESLVIAVMQSMQGNSPLNQEGQFTPDQVRALIARSSRTNVCGSTVSAYINANFSKGTVQGYFYQKAVN